MSIPNSHTIVNICNQRITALEKNAPKGKTQIFINGKRMKVTDVHAFYTHCLEVRAALDSKRAELKATLAEAEAAEAQRVEFDKGLRAWVANQFGPESQIAYEFGFPPRKQAVKSVESKQRAVAQLRATRAARHTMGKRQRQAVVGVVPHETAPPPLPSASSASSPMPAANANGTTNGTAPASPSNGAVAHA